MSYMYNITIAIQSEDLVAPTRLEEEIAGILVSELLDECESIDVTVKRTEVDDDDYDDDDDEFDDDDDYDPDEDEDLEDDEDDNGVSEVPSSVVKLMEDLARLGKAYREHPRIGGEQGVRASLIQRAKERIMVEGDEFLQTGWDLFCEQAGIDKTHPEYSN